MITEQHINLKFLVWLGKTLPKSKKARQLRSRIKLMLIVFFDMREIIHMEFLLQGQTVNQHIYKEILWHLLHSVHKKRYELWQDNTWLLHQDNALAHNTLSICQFLTDRLVTERIVTVLDHPPYSPDLAPCDFFVPQAQGGHQGSPFSGYESYQEGCDDGIEIYPGRILPGVHGGMAEQNKKVH